VFPKISRRAAGASVLLVSATLLTACGNKTTPPTGGPQTTAAIEPPPPAKAPPADVLARFEKPRKPSGPLRIKIITNAVAPFWDPMSVGMDKTAKEMGVTATWSGPTSGAVPEQRRLLEDAVSSGVDGIAMSAINAEALKPVINDLMMKGTPPIPIITIDSDSPDSNRLAYIGTNNFQAGRRAGEAAVKLMPAGGDIVGFVGTQGADNAMERINGFKSVAEPKGIHIIGVLEDQSDKTKARKNVEDAINKYGDKVKGFLGIYSYNGPAIAAAVMSANKRDQYKVMCFDSEPSTIEALKKGNVDFTVVQDPYMFGVDAVKFLTLINRKGIAEAKKELDMPDNYVIDTGVTVVTPSTITAFLGKLAARGIKSS
jgi:ribose transport system substrate-binding protein